MTDAKKNCKAQKNLARLLMRETSEGVISIIEIRVYPVLKDLATEIEDFSAVQLKGEACVLDFESLDVYSRLGFNPLFHCL
jgi:hypothetical protein